MGLGFGEQGEASTAAPGGPGEDVQGWLLQDQALPSGQRLWGLVPTLQWGCLEAPRLSGHAGGYVQAWGC